MEQQTSELMQQLLAVQQKIKILKEQQQHSAAGHTHVQYAPPPSEHQYTKLLYTGAPRHTQPHCTCHLCQQQQQPEAHIHAAPTPPPRDGASLHSGASRRANQRPDPFYNQIPNTARDNIYWEVDEEPNATASSLDWSNVEPYGGNPTLEQPSQCSSQWSSILPDQSSVYPDQSSCFYDPDGYPRDQLSQLEFMEQQLESSLAELSTIMHHSDSSQLQLYTSFKPDDMSLLGALPRQSTPRFLQEQLQSDPFFQQHQQFLFNEPDLPYHHHHLQQDMSQQHYQYPRTSSTISGSQDSLQVAQPVSSSEFSDYVQELAQESTLEDSSLLTLTFSSPSHSTLTPGPSPPHTSLRPPCIGQEESPAAGRDPSSYVPGGDDPTYVNLSPDNQWPTAVTLPESPAYQSIISISQLSSPAPSSANSDATSFMDRGLAPQPVTVKIKASRYHAVKKCLTNVGRQIKKKGPKSGGLKTFAIL